MRALLVALLISFAAGCEQPSTSTPRVLAFTAEWCAPCRKNEPALKAIEAEGYSVTRIDYDAHPDEAKHYGVRTLPTYIVFVGEDEVLRTNSVETLRRKLHSLP